MKTAPIMTKWAADVDVNCPLPEYPRPQLVRDEWLNLNGKWEFGGYLNDNRRPREMPREIIVPYPMESALSDIGQLYPYSWYSRRFTVPESWNGKRIRLHFGAVDYEATVFINGKEVGKHVGGYDAFYFDITDYLVEGEQTVDVHVFDATDGRSQPLGKQILNPHFIWYTSVSGIWQTVWLEPVEEDAVEQLFFRPDVDNGCVKVTVNAPEGTTAQVTVEGVGTVEGAAGSNITIPVPNARLWGPDDPYLYNVSVTLKRGGKVVDRVGSYFGMRKIETIVNNHNKQIYLNGERIFQIGLLDQGFWPDGVYTAPTDEALRYDIEATKEMGFNLIRKHLKIEPQRWYYWADKLGVLVWQDMPAGGYMESFQNDFVKMIKEHYNHPSIVTWIVFNEGSSQHKTEYYVDMLRDMDPTRLITPASGWVDVNAGDICDIHTYPDPGCPISDRARVVGEFGGIGYRFKGHVWDEEKAFVYCWVETEEEFLQNYQRYADQIIENIKHNGLVGAVYTQTTDVEIELNGFLTYDRAIMKATASKIRKINEQIRSAQPEYIKFDHALMPTGEKEGQPWKYTMQQPAEDWYTPGFDDSAWQNGLSPFGSDERDNTLWTPSGERENHIWVRRRFVFEQIDDEIRSELKLLMHHDEDCEVYINGVLAAKCNGFVNAYKLFDIAPEAAASIAAGQETIVAIHCCDTGGGRRIDAGIVYMEKF